MKLLKTLLLATVILATVVMFAGCTDALEDILEDILGRLEDPDNQKPNPEDCEHNNTEYRVRWEATCGYDGTQYKVCLDCSYVFDDEVLPATGHTYENGECIQLCGSIQIGTVDQLRGFATTLKNGFDFRGAEVILTADLDLAGQEMSPIGNYTAFAGTFNGDGHTISNVKIVPIEYEDGSHDTLCPLGFFYANYGTIRNIKFNNIIIDMGGEHGGDMGLVASTNAGTIENCHVTGALTYSGVVTGRNYGGLVANNKGTIDRCSVDAAVSAYTWRHGNVRAYVNVGGMVGSNESEGLIRNSYATGDANGTAWGGAYVGGLVGKNVGSLENCYATGNVTASVEEPSGSNVGAGGLAGNIPIPAENGDRYMKNCFATGTARASGAVNAWAGVLGGLNANGALIPENCYRMNSAAYANNVNTAGEEVNETTLKSAAFYTETLQWSSDIWNMTDGEYPTLK